MMRNFYLSCGLFLGLSVGSVAGLITTTAQNAGVQLDVVGITGFQTTGADMAGMTVTAEFAQSGSQSCIWGATGATSGGCAVAGLFDISEDGDTFSNDWTLRNLSTFDLLLTLTLDGTPARLTDSGVVFDRTFGGAFGTLGSFLGGDATGTTTDASNGDALYSNVVAIQPGAPVGDIFTTLTIRFSPDGLGAGQSGVFQADTDTIGVYTIPEPGTVTLCLAGLAVLGLRRRSSLRSSRP